MTIEEAKIKLAEEKSREVKLWSEIKPVKDELNKLEKIWYPQMQIVRELEAFIKFMEAGHE